MNEHIISILMSYRYKDWGTFVSVPHTPLWIGTQYAKIWPTIDNV